MNLTPRQVIADCERHYLRKPGVIDVHGYRHSILLFVDGGKFKTPITDDYYGIPLRCYDVRSLFDHSIKMLQRMQKEKMDLDDPNTRTFWDVFYQGAAVCKHVLEGTKKHK